MDNPIYVALAKIECHDTPYFIGTSSDPKMEEPIEWNSILRSLIKIDKRMDVSIQVIRSYNDNHKLRKILPKS